MTCGVSIGGRWSGGPRRASQCRVQFLGLEVGEREHPAVLLWSKVLHLPVAVGCCGALRLLVTALVARSVPGRRMLLRDAELAAWLRIKHTRRLRLSGPIGGAKIPPRPTLDGIYPALSGWDSYSRSSPLCFGCAAGCGPIHLGRQKAGGGCLHMPSKFKTLNTGVTEGHRVFPPCAKYFSSSPLTFHRGWSNIFGGYLNPARYRVSGRPTFLLPVASRLLNPRQPRTRMGSGKAAWFRMTDFVTAGTVGSRKAWKVRENAGERPRKRPGTGQTPLYENESCYSARSEPPQRRCWRV
jgi:hypothetical protein